MPLVLQSGGRTRLGRSTLSVKAVPNLNPHGSPKAEQKIKDMECSAEPRATGGSTMATFEDATFVERGHRSPFPRACEGRAM